MGGRSTCTMLYGHVESLADRVDHLRQLRALQDETRGFVGFVPLAYQPQDNDVPVENPPTGFDSLRTIAVSRIYLDNFDHITAYWVGLGLKLAQVALSYGADDLHGTIIEEHIFHMAGATSPQLQTEADMLKAIREAGRIARPAQHLLRTDQSSCRRPRCRSRRKFRALESAGSQSGNGMNQNASKLYTGPAAPFTIAMIICSVVLVTGCSTVVTYQPNLPAGTREEAGLSHSRLYRENDGSPAV